MDCKHNKPTNKVDCIVCEILADYDNDRAIDEMAFFGQPDQDVIIDVLKKLMMIIYPGFYRDEIYRTHTAKNRVAIYSCDITLTVSHLTNFQRNVAELEESFQNRMTERVDNLFEKHGRVYGNTLSRIASFRMSESRNGIAEKIVEARRELRKLKTNIESK